MISAKRQCAAALAALLLCLWSGCASPQAEEPVSEPAEPSAPSTQEEQSSEPEEPRDDAGVKIERVAASMECIPLTREEAGLSTPPDADLGELAPDPTLLALADGTLEYTDAHYAAGILYGMDFPYARDYPRDFVALAPRYGEPVIADLCTGDPMAEVLTRLDDPSLEEESDDYRFYHYRTGEFYLSFMGNDVIEMIGLKRAPPVDYDPELLRSLGALLEKNYGESFLGLDENFGQFRFGIWSFGIIVTNKGLFLESNGRVRVYNDFRGNLYQLHIPAPNAPDYYDENHVSFVNADSNLLAFATYLPEFAAMEASFDAGVNASPGGVYAYVNEVQWDIYYLNAHCFRRADRSRRYIVFGRLESEAVWLDDRYFWTRTAGASILDLFCVEDPDWAMKAPLEQFGGWKIDRVDYDNHVIYMNDGKLAVSYDYSEDGTPRFFLAE